MPTAKKKLTPAKRLALYCQRAKKSGLRRVEVAVPATDVAVIQRFARTFRKGGAATARLRREMKAGVKPNTAKSGADLLARLPARIGEQYELEIPALRHGELRELNF